MRAKPFYVHENQRTQILTLSIPERRYNKYTCKLCSTLSVCSCLGFHFALSLLIVSSEITAVIQCQSRHQLLIVVVFIVSQWVYMNVELKFITMLHTTLYFTIWDSCADTSVITPFHPHANFQIASFTYQHFITGNVYFGEGGYVHSFQFMDIIFFFNLTY